MEIIERKGGLYHKVVRTMYERVFKRECAFCKKEWVTKHPKSQTCSPPCRKKLWWTKVAPQVRHKTRHGYRYIRPIGKTTYVLEHRYVMEQMLKRKLDKNEFVHHINGNRGDNSPKNLIMMTHADHNSIHKTEEAKHRKRTDEGRFMHK